MDLYLHLCLYGYKEILDSNCCIFLIIYYLKLHIYKMNIYPNSNLSMVVGTQNKWCNTIPNINNTIKIWMNLYGTNRWIINAPIMVESTSIIAILNTLYEWTPSPTLPKYVSSDFPYWHNILIKSIYHLVCLYSFFHQVICNFLHW